MAYSDNLTPWKKGESGNPFGRPPIYKDDIHPNMVRDYLVWVDQDDKRVISVAGLACYIGINIDTVYDWANKHSLFSDATKLFKAITHQSRIQEGFNGNHNASLVKLDLQTNHGYTDRHDVTTGGQSLADIAAIMGISSDED